jgi:hypothetical protein
VEGLSCLVGFCCCCCDNEKRSQLLLLELLLELLLVLYDNELRDLDNELRDFDNELRMKRRSFYIEVRREDSCCSRLVVKHLSP